MNAPVLGAKSDFTGTGKWSLAFSWRYQKSDRHFVGHEEQTDRQDEGSQVINQVHQLELAITRHYGPRWSVTVGIPFSMNVRSNAIRDPSLPDNQFGNDPVVARTITQARGLGDITVVPRRWMCDPAKHENFNIALGAGVKLPTGANNVQDTRQVRVDIPGTTDEPFVLTNVVQTVDQSIQLGDGGFGVILDVAGFYRFAQDRGAAYVTGTYLLNPANTSDVATYRGGNAALLPSVPGSEAYMSVPDQYLYRAGATWFPTRRVGLSLGARKEGIPVHDLVGGSNGFRRPGYAFSVEPGFSYTKGPHTWSLLVPIALHRDRQKSVPDREVPPRHGDAAFADYVILAGYFRNF